MGGYKRNVDLYDMFQDLLNSGFGYNDIGLLYVRAVSNIPKISKLSHIPSTNEKTQRKIKKRFQDYLREFFKGVRNDVVMRRRDRKEVLEHYISQDISPERTEVSKGKNIESAINKILSSGIEDPYARIGEAIISGSKDYLSEKPPQMGAYKVFLEYNRTYSKLEDLL